MTQHSRSKKRGRFEKEILNKKPSQTIPVRETISPCPLSFSQERLWFLDQMGTDLPAYSLFIGYTISGPFALDRFKTCLQKCQKRHESLFTGFVPIDGQPVQIIKPDLPLPLTLKQAMGNAADRRKIVSGWIDSEIRFQFDLQKPPLYRCTIFKINPDEHILILNFHHIICDGWSIALFLKELSECYAAEVQQRKPQFADLIIQFADFAVWQKKQYAQCAYLNQLTFWRQILKDLTTLELPADHPRPAVRSLSGGLLRLTLTDEETKTSLVRIARNEKASLFILLLASFQTMLFRYTGQSDVATGIPAANRQLQDVQNVIGFFVNTLVIRNRLDPDKTFVEVLREIRNIALQAYSNQDIPFEKLVQELNPQRTLNRNPLFDVMFSLIQNSPPSLKLEGLKVNQLELDTVTAKFDISVTVIEKDDGLAIEVRYSSDLFHADSISRFVDLYRTLLRQIAAQPDRKISIIPLIEETERYKIVTGWNRTKKQYPRNETVHHLFEMQVSIDPESIAIVDGEEIKSYRQLNEMANKLAFYLIRWGIVPNTPVGVCTGRSYQSVVAFLAVLKAGGAYVPLDGDYPQYRIRQMLDECKIPLVISLRKFRDVLPEGPEYVFLDESALDIENLSDLNPELAVTAEDSCYVMFTSGSTGIPKGVEIPHRGVVSLVKNVDYVQINPASAFLQLASLSFDAATFEIWAPLLNGARCVIYPDTIPDIRTIRRLLYQHKVDILFLTTALYNTLIDEAPDILAHVRQLFVGGEKLSPGHIARGLVKLPNTKIANIYGPTECTTFTSYYPVPVTYDGRSALPIGRPLVNRTMYILDSSLEPVPVGVTGDLYIGGDGLARGYYGQPKLTEEKFILHPFDKTHGARLYKTGDLARYLPDGKVHFIGRKDRQVKRRGFRIELEEIEYVITQHPDVKQCVVVLQETDGTGKRLVAYIVPVAPDSVLVEKLNSYLRQKLPAYMIPEWNIVLEKIPLTPNKKVDFDALPHPEAGEKDGSEPADELELQLVQIWEDLLDVFPIGTGDDFFALGGHSLLAVRLFSRIEKVFGRNLSLATLFQAPTIEHLAEVIRHQGLSGRWPSLVPIKRSGSKPPLFCIHGAGGHVVVYREMTGFLDVDQPVFGLQAQGLDGQAVPFDTVEKMAGHYLKEICEFYPDGPVLLCGLCLGGLVTFELARRFSDLGRHVQFVGLIEASVPPATFLTRRQMLFYTARRWLCRIGSGVKIIFVSSIPEKTAFVNDTVTRLKFRIKSLVWRRAYRRAWQQEQKNLPPFLKQVRQANRLAISRYQPDFYSGQIVLFRAKTQKAGLFDKNTYGWSRVAENVRVVEVEGDHDTVYKPPYVEDLGKKLMQEIKQSAIY
ncbi:amino acid adenylation domain-containing protein [candidate division KSB1 bacterium]|nr:amino acid adenylation domain-containing protein [candidate division KSB1 bacterium]